MSIHLPQPRHRLTLSLLGYGLVLLVWLSLEDNGTLSVAVLGTGAALLFTLGWLLQRIGGRELPVRLWFPGGIVLGGIIGAASSLMTTLLMFFKTGWHGHAFADYPPEMLLAMLQRLPVWTLAGLLIGLALALMKLSLTENTVI
jgi:hypothetical protein